MNKQRKIILITAVVFLTEAIIHYNIGVNKGKETFKFELPPTKEFVRVAGVVLVFSIISTKLIQHYTN